MSIGLYFSEFSRKKSWRKIKRLDFLKINQTIYLMLVYYRLCSHGNGT